MAFQPNAQNLDGQPTQIHIDDVPDVCPVCHRGIHAKFISAAMLDGHNRAQVLYRCPHQDCQQLFIGTYWFGGHTNGRPRYEKMSLAPKSAEPGKFPDSIAPISPAFIEIYNQAMAAESHNLPQLVGIGLRKSLEFLIKDFLVSEHPEQAEAIKKTLLGPCIDQFVSDQNVKSCAKLATWLGNDETHYVRKWEDKDINDLKRLLRLTVNWIDNFVLTKKYVAEMAPKTS